jgi:hypothetical protein
MLNAERIARRAPVCALALALSLAGAACDGLLDSGQEYATEAQVTVTGTSPAALRLILSNNYTTEPDPTTGQIIVLIQAADTFDASAPIDRTYPLGQLSRILVRLENSDPTMAADIRIRVLLDGTDLVYDRTATLTDDFLEYRFSYF